MHFSPILGPKGQFWLFSWSEVSRRLLPRNWGFDTWPRLLTIPHHQSEKWRRSLAIQPSSFSKTRAVHFHHRIFHTAGLFIPPYHTAPNVPSSCKPKAQSFPAWAQLRCRITASLSCSHGFQETVAPGKVIWPWNSTKTQIVQSSTWFFNTYLHRKYFTNHVHIIMLN